MGPPSYMQSVIDRNVIMRRMTVTKLDTCIMLHWISGKELTDWHLTYRVNMMTPHAQLKQNKKHSSLESHNKVSSQKATLFC